MGVGVLCNNGGQMRERLVDKSVDEGVIKALSMEESTVNILTSFSQKTKDVKYHKVANAWQT